MAFRGLAMERTERSAQLQTEVATLRATVAQLEQALRSRVVIEQAKGVLAERYDLAIADAFALLRFAARSARRNLHELAAEVVERRAPHPAIVVAEAHRARWTAAAQRERAEAQRATAEAALARARSRCPRCGDPLIERGE
jgi:hypothetical protein